ncbi:MAG: sortase domain-containing protein [Actinomycetota bacterium]
MSTSRAGVPFFAGLALVLALNAACAAPSGVGAPPSAAPSSTAVEQAPGPGQGHEPGHSPEQADHRKAASKAPVAATGGSSPVMEKARPTALSIPRIDLRSDIMGLAQREDRTLEVPPGEAGSPAGWYVNSPAPGERGPSILLGHVNALGGGPGVFARLNELVPGDEVRIERDDGTTAVFRLTAIKRYAKDSFPALQVYGNTKRAEIRLITCDGYNVQNGRFEDNLVAYGKLTVDS